MDAPITELDTHGAPAPSPVTPITLFWAYLAFTLSYIIHPLSGSVGLEPSFRILALLLPFSPFFDTVDLLWDVFWPPKHHCHLPSDPVCNYGSDVRLCPSAYRLTFKQALRHSVNCRTKSKGGESTGGQDILSLRKVNQYMLLRIVVSCLSVLQFAKVCGYSNLGFGLFWAILMFVPWVLLEVLEFLATYCATEIPCAPRWGVPECGSEEIHSLMETNKYMTRSIFVSLVICNLYGINFALISFCKYSKQYRLDSGGTYAPVVAAVNAPVPALAHFLEFGFGGLEARFFFGLEMEERPPPGAERRHLWNMWSMCALALIYVVAGNLLYLFFVYDLHRSTKAAWTEYLP